MKKLQKSALLSILSTIWVMTLIVTPSIVTAATNLITNGSFETESATPNIPESWFIGGWGSSTKSHQTIVTGLSGKAVRVSISDYVDGDAKWYPADVAVTAGANYIYTDYYKSDVPSRVVVRYNTGTCVTLGTNCIHDELAVLPAGADWTKFQTQFLIPENVVSITIFHLIEADGTLDLDDVSLEKVVQLEIVDMVPNNSLEQGTGEDSVPLAWYTGNWGTNSPVFEYITNEGQDGTRSVKVTLSEYTDGDAKWYFEPQSVEAGKDYKFSAWFKTNVVPHAVVQFIKADNSVSYFGLQRPQPNGQNWQQYESEFAVPSGVVKATVFLFIDTVGWLQTDNYHITPYTYEGFDRALVTLTFDDGAEANVNTVLPLVNSLNLLTTNCYATSFVEGDDINTARILAFYNTGHEVCSHTVNHPDLTALNETDLDYELLHSKEYLESIINSKVTDFASPFGAYNESVNDKIKTIYTSHRTVDNGYNSKNNLDVYRLKVQNMEPTTTLTEFQYWVNKAIEDKTWLILVYHDVNSEAEGVTPYGTYIPDFENQMNWLALSGVTVKTYKDALAEVMGESPFTCEAGTHKVGTNCIQDTVVVCDAGSTLVGDTCVSDPIICDAGTHLEGSTCVPDPIVCDAGSTLVGDTCVLNTITCPNRTHIEGIICVPDRWNTSGSRPRTIHSTPILNIPVLVTPTPQVLGVNTSQNVFTTYLIRGSAGSQVEKLQLLLQKEGVYTGPITGYFGDLTKEAVITYQAKYSIAQTGTVGPITRNKLNEQQSLVQIISKKDLQDQIVMLQAMIKRLVTQIEANKNT